MLLTTSQGRAGVDAPPLREMIDRDPPDGLVRRGSDQVTGGGAVVNDPRWRARQRMGLRGESREVQVSGRADGRAAGHRACDANVSA